MREKIRGSLRNHLLPRLCGTLAGKAKGPTAVADEDELVQRVPLAGPIVRLLQLDSAAAVERHVPGIVAKLGSFLKSKVTRYRTLSQGSDPPPPSFLCCKAGRYHLIEDVAKPYQIWDMQRSCADVNSPL